MIESITLPEPVKGFTLANGHTVLRADLTGLSGTVLAVLDRGQGWDEYVTWNVWFTHGQWDASSGHYFRVGDVGLRTAEDAFAAARADYNARRGVQ